MTERVELPLTREEILMWKLTVAHIPFDLYCRYEAFKVVTGNHDASNEDSLNLYLEETNRVKAWAIEINQLFPDLCKWVRDIDDFELYVFYIAGVRIHD